MNGIQVVITRDPQGNVMISSNPAAAPRDPYELLGLLDIAAATVRESLAGFPAELGYKLIDLG